MASPTAERDRLDALDREIDVLEARLVHEEQEAHGIIIADTEDEKACERLETKAFITKQRILQKLHEHRRLARELLAARCPIHPADALIVACPDCRRAWRYQEVG